jgi:hypothetical protein
MSEARPDIDATLHRNWRLECVLVRADDPRSLTAALDDAGSLLAREPEMEWPVAARAVTQGAVEGRLTVAVVADSKETLAARLEQAKARLAAGAETIDDGGIFYEREPRHAAGQAIWLFDGAEAVRQRMFEALALHLPGFVNAFDRVAAQSEDPGRVADYLCGPDSYGPGLDGPGESLDLEPTTRARLALAGGRAMAGWLLRILPPPRRALGGPGENGPWLDSSRLCLDDFDDCDLAAVAAAPARRWDDILAALPAAADAVVIHVGPGSPAIGRADTVAMQPAGTDGLRGLLEGLARLAAQGLAVDTSALFDCRGVPAQRGSATRTSRGMPVVFHPRSPRFDPKAVTPPARAANGVAAHPVAPAATPGAASAAAPAAPAAAAALASSAPPGGGRTDIVLEHLETMRLFLDQHQRTVQRFYGAQTNRSTAAAPGSGPMVHHVEQLEGGKRLLASARYDVEEAVFLKQHTPNVSAVSSSDRQAFGLPVMPLTFSMEALAEAAAILVPGRVVTGLEQLSAQHWMSFERGVVDARIAAEVIEDDGGRVVVAARLFDPHDSRRVYLSGRVVLETAYPRASQAPAWRVPAAYSCGWGASEIYPRRGFHGPMLQAITLVDQHGDAGMTGELTVLPRAPLFASGAEPVFQIDPVLLDSLGMGVGIWTWREAMNGVYPVPVRVGRVRLYGPPCPEGETLRMEVRVTRNTDGMIAADLAAVRSDGSLHAEVEHWEDYVYRLPLSVHRLAADPIGQLVTTSVAPPASGGEWDDLAICEFPALPPGFLTAAEGIWEKILAWFWLSPAERDEWWALDGDARRRHLWLAERATLKDAARQVLSAPARKLGAYDVAIRTTPSGKPAAAGVSLAVARRGERIVAVAGLAERGALGIALEPAEAVDRQAVADGFSADDRLRLRNLAGDWLARAWCAKAAAAEALGADLDDDARTLGIGEIDHSSGRIRLVPSGAWSRLPGARAELEVATTRSGEDVLAVCRARP